MEHQILRGTNLYQKWHAQPMHAKKERERKRFATTADADADKERERRF
jgi:hypothetical protein